MIEMDVKLLLPKDADFSIHGGYECEWVYNHSKEQLLLAIQKYSSVDYTFILFDKVVGYKFSNWMFDELRIRLNKEGNEGFLYEIALNNNEKSFKHYLTFQPSRGSLQIYAFSYKVLFKLP